MTSWLATDVLKIDIPVEKSAVQDPRVKPRAGGQELSS